MARTAFESGPTNSPMWNQSLSANPPSGDDDAAAEVDDEPPDPDPAKSCQPAFVRRHVGRPAVGSSLLTRAIRCPDDGEDNEDQADADQDSSDPSVFVRLSRRRSMASNISIASSAAELTSDTGLTSPSRPSTPSTSHHLEPSILRIASGHFSDLRALLGFESKVAPQVAPPQVAPPPVKAADVTTPKAETAKKRCISFACGNAPLAAPAAAAQPTQSRLPAAAAAAGPTRPPAMVKTPSAQEAPRRPCIKFACPARPASTQNTPPLRPRPEKHAAAGHVPLPLVRVQSPSTPRRSTAGPSPRSTPPRQSKSPAPSRRPKCLRATSTDLVSDASHYHEFASSESREDDWIRQAHAAIQNKITIDDTLVKENHIRRIAKEAEEEAELEEQGAAEQDDDDDDDNIPHEGDDDNEDEEDDLETVQDEEENVPDGDDDSHADEHSDNSDGYHSDEETGFADSDEEDAYQQGPEPLWIPAGPATTPFSRASGPWPTWRRSSLTDPPSDASTAPGNGTLSLIPRVRPRRPRSRPETPDLPDSTDFVCGTLDEDKPLEEAYMSCLQERKRNKLQVIAQDIDPSFPASDPENEDDGAAGGGAGSDDHVWVHGEMEDLHHDEARARRRKREQPPPPPQVSPRRFHSPPPPSKRIMSPPPPKARGRSPRRGVVAVVADKTSPRRFKSPPPLQRHLTLPALPGQHHHHHQQQRDHHHHHHNHPAAAATTAATNACFDISVAKSLPRPAGLMGQVGHAAAGRRGRANAGLCSVFGCSTDGHVRGAVDIVMGLEQKRKRRREKFLAKYCDRARRGQLPERRIVPGTGAEKMKEIGLLMAGRKGGQSQFVISV